jgi:hypothetical protein
VDVVKRDGITTVHFLPTARVINDLPQTIRCKFGRVGTKFVPATGADVEVKGSSARDILDAFTHMKLGLGAKTWTPPHLMALSSFETTLTDAFVAENANGTVQVACAAISPR